LPSRIQSGSVGKVLIGDWESSLAAGENDGRDVRSTPKRYLVSVETASLPAELGVFSGGRARVKIASSTLLSHLNQQLQRTFQYR
ncbi:hypothetical protein N9Y42_11330, partial [Mariniblastus sp.]|nr:hypothetical protein [Mariniblastus sp.]